MTIKEATLKSPGDLNRWTNDMEVYHHIVDNYYYDFGTTRTHAPTISTLHGDFIRNKDTRVKRIFQMGNKKIITVMSKNISSKKQ
ncbi:MAG: hypothetical protein AAF934_00965 [Bacteroidota bacterium]